MKKRMMYLLFVLLALNLTACGGKPVKSESEIAADLTASEYLPADGMEVSDVNILLRKTDKDKGLDEVTVTAGGYAGGSRFDLSYTLYYEYYDKGGWTLQRAEQYFDVPWEIMGTAEEQILRDLQSQADGVLGVSDIENYTTGYSSLTANMDSAEYSMSLQINAQSDSYQVRSEAEVTVSYHLTSDGWKYTDMCYDSLRVIPLFGADTAVSELFVQEQYGNPTQLYDCRSDWENASETHYVLSVEEHNYLDVATLVAVNYVFDPELLCWNIQSDQALNTEFRWDVVGTWYAEGRVVNNQYPDGFDYKIICVVTQDDPETLRVDYDCLNPIVPWKTLVGIHNRDTDETASGTCYVDLSQVEKSKINQGIWGSKDTGEWEIKMDLPGTKDELCVHSEKGIYIDHFSWGSYAKQLARIQ